MSDQPDPGANCRLNLLVAEDEMMVAMSLETLLDVMGHNTIVTGRLSQAQEIAEADTLDGALLDINLRGEAAYPIAEILERRGIPFAFTTGYSADSIEPRWRDRPVLEKPFDPDDLDRLIDSVFIPHSRCN